MHPQVRSPNIFMPELQRIYARHGVKYVIFITNYKNVKTPPLQLPHHRLTGHQTEDLLYYPHKKIGYLSLFKQFDDSLIYEFDQTISYDDYKFILNDNIYLFLPGYYTFTEANNMCNYLNMHLVIIDDIKKNNLITTIAPYYPIWLGGEKNKNNKWSWVNGNNIVFFNWKSLEPNNYHGNEDKIIMYAGGKWNDLNGNLRMRVVCEEKNNFHKSLKILRNKYMSFNNKMIQKHASEFCNELDANLLIVDSIVENQYVKYYFDLQEPIWIDGLFDSYINKWNLKSSNNFVNWAPYEPNNDKNAETRIIMRPDGLWNDTNQNGKFNFICEFDMNSGSSK